MNIKTPGKWFIGASLALVLGLGIHSCIDTRYDLNKGISTKIALGGDSLAIPLGSTDTIRIGDLLNADSIDILLISEDGSYGINMKDSLSVEIPDIDKQTLQLEEQDFRPEPIFISFGDISLEDFSIPGIHQESTMNLNISEISLEDFAIPSIDKTDTYGSGMKDYALDPASLNVDIDPVEVLTPTLLKEGSLSVPANIDPPIEVPLLLPNDTLDISNESEMSFSFDVPDGVSHIDRVELKQIPKPAVFKIELKLLGAVTANDNIFTQGSILPNILIDPTDLFVFNESTPLNAQGRIEFGFDQQMNNANAFTTAKEMYIDAFNITEEPVEGSITLLDTVRAQGYVVVDTLYLFTNNFDAATRLNFVVEISIDDVVIESMKFDIPVLQTDITGSTPFSVDNEIEKEIKTINTVHFEHPGSITIQLTAEHFPEMETQNVVINELAIVFPDQFVIEPTLGLTDNTFLVLDEDFDPLMGKEINLTLLRLDMSEIALEPLADVQKIQWEDSIRFNGTVTMQGRIDSRNIPTENEDAGMKIQISSVLAFDYAEVITNQISEELPATNIDLSFDIDIAKEVKRMDTVKMIDNTYIHLEIDLPELALDIEGDIKIAFPPLFGFDPPLANNEFHILGQIPESIDLQLASLNINQNLSKGKLNLDDSIKISGTVHLLSGEVSSKEIEGLSDKTMTIRASTDDLKISSTSLSLNSLQAEFSDSTHIDIPTIDLPKEILSLDSILLGEGAVLELNVNIENMPELSSPLMLDFALQFPNLFYFMPGTVDAENIWSIDEPLIDGKLNKKLNIKGLKFDGKNLGGELNINEIIKYNADISVTDPSVNSDELTGDSIKVGMEVKLSGVNFQSVYGKVDPGIKPEIQEVPIEGLPEFLQDTSFVLDINPVLAIRTSSNLGIPLVASIKLTPVIDELDQTDKIQEIGLNLTRSVTAADTAYNYFWIAKDSAGMPDHYHFLQTNINDVFSTIPEKIKMEMLAETDISVQHELDLDAQYFIDVHYDLSVPLSFGKDFNLTIRDTIGDLEDSGIGEMAFEGGGLELFGNISNSIPMELDIEIIPIDQYKETIPIKAVTQKIQSGKADGSATDTDISIKILDPDGLMKDLSGFILIFTASSNETVAGTAIKPENFVKATLKARLFGGIVIGE